jgi:hypothetical protein
MSKKSNKSTPNVDVPAAPAEDPVAASNISVPGNELEAPSAPVKPWKALFERLFGVDLRALALLRIGLALLVLCDLSVRVLDLEAHYTEFGVMPRDAVLLFNGGSYWSYLSPYMWTGVVQSFLHISEVNQVAILFGITAFFALMMLVGYRTRMANVLVWALLCALHTRNPMVLHGGDLLTRVMLFWGMFVPLGARYSVDGGAAIVRAYGKALPTRIATVGTACLLLQVAIMYVFTIFLKHGAAWRTEFTAIYYALSIDQYGTPFGRLLLNFPSILPLLTIVTIVWEGIGPVLAFLPWKTAQFRAFAVAGFIFFHLIAINLAMDIGSFPYVASVAWLAYMPSFVFDGFAKGWGRGPDWFGKRFVGKIATAAITARNHSVRERVKRGVSCPTFRMGWTGRVLAVACFIYTILFNLRTVDKTFWAQVLVPTTDIVSTVTRLDQMWGMFSPYPITDDGWFIMPGHLVDGTEVNLFNSKDPKARMTYKKPAFVAGMYKNERWRKYLMNIWSPNNQTQRPYYAGYLCHNWNRFNVGAQELYDLKLIFMREDTQPPGKPYKQPY